MATRNCNDCDCDEDNVVSREIIQDHIGFCVAVSGDYTADADDEVIHVTTPAGGPVAVITLPCPDSIDHDCAHITVVAQLNTATVEGLNDDGTGSATVAAGTAMTFWLSEGVDECADSFWIGGCCATGATA